MGRPLAVTLAAVAVLVASILVATPNLAASPTSGTISSAEPSVRWTGGPFIASNPLSCSLAPVTCDRFSLTVVAPREPYVVRVVVVATQHDVDDIDLFLRDARGAIVGRSATADSREEIAIPDLSSGTYTVEVQPFLVVPPSTYSGFAAIEITTNEPRPNAFRATRVGPDFQGVPQNTSAPFAGQQFEVSFNSVGRRAGEPTIGVDRKNRAFFAAADFDSALRVPGVARFARTVILRSDDKGRTWLPVSPELPLIDTTTEPPLTLDPWLHVDPVTGRVFSIDLYVGCSYLLFSDEGGTTWERNPVACGSPINDHQSIVTAPPAPGLVTAGYPRMLYYCFNRVSDSSCGRSQDGGRTFGPSGANAYPGVEAGEGICGGLTGQVAADSAGRIFLPKGHCGRPTVAVSEDGGTTWTRTRIADHIVMAHHEMALAVDAADNVYAVWTDANYLLPFLSVSTDHGRTWSTPAMIAPPQVHEVNIPTIVAGDSGRIAVVFPGTRSGDRDDGTRPWDLYVMVSTNALAAEPIFAWTIANDLADPVHRGDCGPGRCLSENGGNMLDFLDIQVSPVDGVIWATGSDTCVGACVKDPTARGISPGEGIAVRQTKGPSLFVSR